MGKRGRAVAAVAGVCVIAAWLSPRASDRDSPAPPRAAAPHASSAVAPSTRSETSAAPAPVAPSEARVAEPPPVAAPNPLEDERELRGRVVDAHDAPIGGALVEVRRDTLDGVSHLDVSNGLSRDGVLVASATTSADGAFAFPLPPGRTVELRADAAGYAPERSRCRFAGQFVVVRLQAGATVSGRVTRKEDGTPLAGATARTWRTSGAFGATTEAPTDADGRYALADLAPGRYTLEIVPENAAASPWVNFTLEAGQSLEKDFALPRGATVTGRVTSAATGEPIASAEIGEGWWFRRTVTTDAEGRYVFAGFGSWGVNELTVRAAGFGLQSWAHTVTSETALVHDFALDPGRVAKGRVVDASGAPVPDAYVAVFGSVGGNETQKIDWLPTHSGADGRFTIASVRPDIVHTVLVKKDGFGTAIRDFPSSETEAMSIDLGDVLLPVESALFGEVLDESKRPVPGAEVIARPADFEAASRRRSFYGAVRSTTSDESGRFRFAGLAPGSYRVRCRREGRPDDPRTGTVVDVAEGETKRGLRLELFCGLSIAGTVVDPDGEPVADVFVKAIAADRKDLGWVRCDQDGRFRLDGLPAGDHALEVMNYFEPLTAKSGARLGPARLDGVAAGSGDVRITLPEISAVSGVVLEASREKSARASVTAEWTGGGYLQSVTADDDGRFTLEVPEGSTVTLRVRAAIVDSSVPGGVRSLWNCETILRDVAAGSTGLEIVLPERPEPTENR